MSYPSDKTLTLRQQHFNFHKCKSCLAGNTIIHLLCTPAQIDAPRNKEKATQNFHWARGHGFLYITMPVKISPLKGKYTTANKIWMETKCKKANLATTALQQLCRFKGVDPASLHIQERNENHVYFYSIQVHLFKMFKFFQIAISPEFNRYQNRKSIMQNLIRC